MEALNPCEGQALRSYSRSRMPGTLKRKFGVNPVFDQMPFPHLSLKPPSPCFPLTGLKKVLLLRHRLHPPVLGGAKWNQWVICFQKCHGLLQGPVSPQNEEMASHRVSLAAIFSETKFSRLFLLLKSFPLPLKVLEAQLWSDPLTA